MGITIYTAEFIRKVRKEASPKGCHPVQGFLEDLAFVEAFKEGEINIYQLIQIVGCRVHVSRTAAEIIAENYLCRN